MSQSESTNPVPFELTASVEAAKNLFRHGCAITDLYPDFAPYFPRFSDFYLHIEKLVKDDLRANIASRVPIDAYAMILAVAASMRSEDPARKVGAVALDHENRVVATAYNGLAKGQYFGHDWWASDDNRRTFVVHAEANLCSLTHRGEVKRVAVTTMPCGPCALNLVAHGVEEVFYGVDYPTDPRGREIFETHGVAIRKVDLKLVATTMRHHIHKFVK